MLFSIVDVQVSERVTCYTINPVPFNDLCNGSGSIINNKAPYYAYLTYNTKDGFIGKGTFKTTHSASISWIGDAPKLRFARNINGSHLIAMKRPYDDKNGKAIKRFNYADESQKVLTEANLLGWADSLLLFSYQFIDHFISLHGSPSFDIPRFRFVNAAIAYSEKAIDSSVKSPALSHRAVYLLEEFIPQHDDFIKYIHNGDAVPLQERWERGYETGQFLCFIQHVQFVQTHGQAYISDFQGTYSFSASQEVCPNLTCVGAGNLLTDPQIMTCPYAIHTPKYSILLISLHRDLSEQEELKDNLFGEGNVNSAFENFTKQHECNKYCEFFELSRLSSDDDTD